MGGGDGEGDVVNQYKQALRDGLPPADDRADTIRSAFTKVATSLMAGAWKSTRADQFGHALSHHTSRLQSLADDERDAIEAKLGVEKDKTEPNTWRADFFSFSHHRPPGP